jgi:hypothetical protein
LGLFWHIVGVSISLVLDLKKKYNIGSNIVFSGRFSRDIVAVVIKNGPFLADIRVIVAVVVSN